MKNKALVIIFLCCLGVNSVYSQTTSDFESFRSKMYEGFSGFREKAINDYEKYRAEINKAYSDYIRKPWKESTVVKGDTIKEKNLVVPPIKYEGKPEPEPTPAPIDVVPITIQEEPLKQPNPVVPIEVNPNTLNHRVLNFTLYGTKMSVHVPKSVNINIMSINKNDIAECWSRCANGDWDKTLEDCLKLRKKHNLCDWAYLQMLKTMVGQLNISNHNASTIILSYLYSNSGYKMRLASGSGRLYLMLASHHQIYDWPYYVIGGDKMYPLECDERNVYICDAEFPNEQPLSLLVTTEQNIEMKTSTTRVLESKKGVVVNSQINENLLEFYNTFPTSSISDNLVTRWAIYANTPLSSTVAGLIYPQLKKQIAGKTETGKVSSLLNFVQTAFVYEYDNKVWGDDRAFFAEETLFYPYCDCEDRSIFFSRLVRDLVGLDVALVYYPGHLATAVNFNDVNVKGDYIMIDGRKFIICDPTYINAPVGASMPNLDNDAIQAIVLK